jgi:hypothetical protein
MVRLIKTRRSQLFFEPLEARYAPANLTVPLNPLIDQFGDQIGAYQSYNGTDVVESIFDTGASAITFAPDVQDYLNIPIKVPDGAIAGGIGGEISGDVSMPGTIYADGLHAIDLSDFFDFTNYDLSALTYSLDPAHAAAAPGVQALVGTTAGSPDLPTITGTPILNPSPAHPNGLAAKIDLQGYSFDLLAGLAEYLPEFSGDDLIWTMPDLHFVEPGTLPATDTDTVGPIYIPMGFFGSDNHTNPGDNITETASPMQPNVGLVYQDGGAALSGKHFLFDTGAQLSIISTATALELGIDLSQPETTMAVQGVGGSVDVPGFTLKQLDVPTTTGDKLIFTDVPVYVLDVAPDLDGILGMNLFNPANSMVYDPFNPAGSRLGVTFHTTPRDVLPDDPGDLLDGLFMDSFPFYANLLNGHQLPGFDISSAAPANAATTTTLTATPNASTGGALVTFTATVLPSPGAAGTVNFIDNGSALPGGSNVPLVAGVASFQISTLGTGPHTVSAAYSGGTGFLASTSNTLNFNVAAAAPKVLSVTTNGNLPNMAGQSSRIVSVVAVFDQAVQLDTDAFTLALHTNNVVFGGVAQANGFGSIPTSLVLTPSSDKKTWTITFSGNTDNGADGMKSLKDGVYDFKINAAKVHPLGTPAVAMASNSTMTFHRLYGDLDLPATLAGGTPGVDYQTVVNTGDNLAFRTAFNSAANYKSYFDFDGDGVINTGDNLEFRDRFNKTLTWKV